ncbi:MAG: hypothetical protein ABF244_10505, partial [Flavobacteriaceae bacterium]
MKRLLFLILLIFIGSCCGKKGPYVVPGMQVSYENLGAPKELMLIETERGNLSQVIDTSSLGELNSNNSYKSILSFGNNSPNYILYIEGTSYQDTLSDIYFEEDQCKN